MASWLDSLTTTPAMRAVFSDRGRLQGMLDFEAALARAEARLGVIPPSVVAPIAAACRAELYNPGALAAATATAGNPAIPMIQALRERVRLSEGDAEAARFVHFGATSQDAMDTGLMLQLKAGVALVSADLGRIAAALGGLARTHQGTLIVGRTWLQQAQPTTFGLKVAGWLDAVRRDEVRLAAYAARGLAVQIGGAVGTLAAIGPAGLEVAAALAGDLGLACPLLPWHTQRDRVAEAGTTLALVVGTMGKIARDASLMMQTEVAEVFEPDAPGRGGSSAMPQKRNPIGSSAVLAAAARVPALAAILLGAMAQAHERGLGDWQAEWETLPEIALLAGGAVAQIAQLLDGLEVDAARMRENLDATGGQIYAGAVAIALTRAGMVSAHAAVEKACRRAAAERRPLREVLAEDAEIRGRLGDAELDRLFDPANAVGLAAALVERMLRS